MTDGRVEEPERSLAGLTRRERLERIANAERDRRGGRHAVATAAIGEPNEWPARVILALARLTVSDEAGARRLLEEGLDRWAHEAGLAPLDGRPSSDLVREEQGETAAAACEANAAFARPFDRFELDRAFAEAEAEVDQMHDVNGVAARVLMFESADSTESYELASFDDEDEASGSDVDVAPDVAGADDDGIDAAGAFETQGRAPSGAVALATLERWLHNLERGQRARLSRDRWAQERRGRGRHRLDADGAGGVG